MKKPTPRILAIILSIFLFTFVFGSGFLLGTTKSPLRSQANAQEKLDLEPFWKVLALLEERFVSAKGEDISEEKKVFGAISGLVEAYGDPYTTFFPPKENENFQESLTGAFQGIGAEIGIRDDKLVVVSPLKDSPAEKAGLLPEDQIIAIDGESAIGFSVEEAVNIIRGEKGTEVVLTIIRKDLPESIDVSIVRDRISLPTLDTEIRGDVFIISLYNFNATAPDEFRQALREFVRSKRHKLVLDLRGNPGGFLEGAVDITSWFLPLGETVVVEDFGKGEDNRVFRSKGYNIFNNKLKMVVLVNKGSASASEIVAGALREHGIATLVGETTFGKGSVQELLDVTDNTAIKITIARWLTPEGNSISNGGLVPDVAVELTREDVEKEIDTQLEKAIEILKAQ
jgi:carboxyl-terminal processing protease